MIESSHAHDRDGIGSHQSGVAKTDEGEQQPDPGCRPIAQARRNGRGDEFSRRCERQRQEEHARPEYAAERDLPRNLLLHNHRVREKGVEAHTRRDTEWQVRIEPHQERHARGHEHGGGQYAVERHAGIRGSEDGRVHHHDVGHREEGGDPADDVGSEGCRCVVGQEGECMRGRRR